LNKSAVGQLSTRDEGEREALGPEAMKYWKPFGRSARIRQDNTDVKVQLM